MNYEFLLVMLCQVLMELGDQLLSISFAIQVYKTFGTGAALSTYYFVRTVPTFLLGPPAGVVIDRLDKKKLIIATCLVTSLIIAFLPVSKSILSLLVITFVLSSATTLLNPGIHSILPLVIRKDYLLEANSFISATESIARFAAPLLSALIVGVFGSAAGFYTTAIVTAMAGLILLPLRVPTIQTTAEGQFSLPSVYHNIVEGVKYVLQSKLLVWITIVVSCVMLADTTVSPLFSIMVARELHTEPASIGYLSSLWGIGFLFGNFLLPFLKRIGINILFFSGVFCIGLQMGLYSVIKQFWMTIPLQIICGLGFAFFFSTMRTIVQSVSSSNIVGRVLVSISTCYSFISLFGIKIGGFITDTMGVRIVFLYGSIICLAAAVVFLMLFGFSKTQENSNLISGIGHD